MRYLVSLLVCLVLYAATNVAARSIMTGCRASVEDGVIKDSGLSVLGISSGAFAAHQILYAYSSLLDGAGLVAGGPWFSAQANVALAVSLMKDPSLVNVPLLLKEYHASVATGFLDPHECLKSTRSFVFASPRDTVVHYGVSTRLVTLQTALNASHVSHHEIQAEHSFPTAAFGNDCMYLGPMYINACGFDTAGYILDVVSVEGTLRAPASDLLPESNFYRVRQAPFAKLMPPLSLATVGLDSVAYAYIPTNCRHVLDYSTVRDTIMPWTGEAPEQPVDADATPESIAADIAAAERAFAKLHGENTIPASLRTEALLQMRARGGHYLRAGPNASMRSGVGNETASCRVHVAMHGCEQTRDNLGSTFAQYAGYNRWAESNNIVMLYPFAVANVLNPKGCWDWWGYSSTAYASKLAPQTLMVMRMLTAFRYNQML